MCVREPLTIADEQPEWHPRESARRARARKPPTTLTASQLWTGTTVAADAGDHRSGAFRCALFPVPARAGSRAGRGARACPPGRRMRRSVRRVPASDDPQCPRCLEFTEELDQLRQRLAAAGQFVDLLAWAQSKAGCRTRAGKMVGRESSRRCLRGFRAEWARLARF